MKPGLNIYVIPIEEEEGVKRNEKKFNWCLTSKLGRCVSDAIISCLSGKSFFSRNDNEISLIKFEIYFIKKKKIGLTIHSVLSCQENSMYPTYLDHPTLLKLYFINCFKKILSYQYYFYKRNLNCISI